MRIKTLSKDKIIIISLTLLMLISAILSEYFRFKTFQVFQLMDPAYNSQLYLYSKMENTASWTYILSLQAASGIIFYNSKSKIKGFIGINFTCIAASLIAASIEFFFAVNPFKMGTFFAETVSLLIGTNIICLLMFLFEKSGRKTHKL